MPTRKRLRRSEQSSETRERLFQVSLHLFVRRGYAGTGIRDIANGAGVSLGLMFHYFPSKQALLEAHARRVDGGLELVASLLRPNAPPLESFAAVAKTVLESLRDPGTRDLFLLANQILSLESIPKPARRLIHSRRAIDASIPLIKDGQRRREIRPGDAVGLALAFWGALQGIAELLVWYPDGTIPDHRDIVAMLKA